MKKKGNAFNNGKGVFSTFGKAQRAGTPFLQTAHLMSRAQVEAPAGNDKMLSSLRRFGLLGRQFQRALASYEPHHLFPLGTDETEYEKLSSEGISKIDVEGESYLKVDTEILKGLAQKAVYEIQHFFRKDHLEGLKKIMEDDEATENDKFVADQLLKNAVISAQGEFPSCQDTGTAIVLGEKGHRILTNGLDEGCLEEGIFKAYSEDNLRYSQVAPLSMFEEKNTGCNLPAMIEIEAKEGDEYNFLFVAKGGGSANKSQLFQKTKALLTPELLEDFLRKELAALGTAACPPYHLSIVIGGLSAELTMKVVKLASCRALDQLPFEGGPKGHAFRDVQMEEKVLKMTQELGIGAQFGGKYFCHQVRVIRMPRHGASLPVGLGVSCSADRQIKAKINENGVFLEKLVHDPASYIDFGKDLESSATVTEIDLNQSMDDIRKALSNVPVKSRVSLNGPIVVARDIAHMKIYEELKATGELPQYMKDYVVYYAGPAKTPEGYASGSFGPTTASRMDPYVAEFMQAGGSFVTLAKGNRSQQLKDACKDYGGFYLGSIGGPAAVLGKEHITKVEVLAHEDLGMEAVWMIQVKDFPAFVVTDDKGDDFFDLL